MDFSLSRSSILRSRKEIESLLEQRRAVVRYPVKAVFAPSGEGTTRMMVSVPKRNFKRAVARNLLKRRIREAFRLNRELLCGGQFNILFVYIGRELADYAAISSKVKECLGAIASENGKTE